VHSLNTLSSRKSLTRTTPKLSSEEFKEKRALVSKEMGKKMLAGWNLLEKACPYCVMPLMTEHVGSEEVCVLCGPLEEKKRVEDIKQKQREQLEEQERLQLEMEQMEMEKQRRKREEEELQLRLAKEAEEKKKQAELKRLKEEEFKTKIDAEVKKREDEIKEDLKKAEDFVRAKNHNVNDEIQRNAERARLVNERKRFEEIVKEVKKIDDVRKRQEEEDSKSVDSRRSRASFGSRRSRSSYARVSRIDDGDDASVGGVSIQFPPDFDYDDEDAIRQVIAMAKLQKKSSPSPRDIRSPSGEAASPPMSIAFVNKGNNNNPPSPMALDSPRKRNYLPRSSGRTPRLPPASTSASSFSSALLRDHARAMENNHPTATGEEFDDGVSYISMGDNDHHHPAPTTPSTIMSSERESRRERIMNKLNSSSSSRAASPSPRMSSRRKALSPRSSSLTRISSRRSVSDINTNGISSNASLTMTPTRRSSRLRSSDAGSVTSASSRKSALGDILSKIENAKAQLVKKTDDDGM